MNFNRDSDSLVPVSALPQPFQSIFHYRYFNSVQSESFSTAYLSDDNMVVSAPTGSGKTGLFELCMLRLLTKCLGPDNEFNHPRGVFKTVYIAPTKALIQEKLRDWHERFGSKTLGLICQEVTGDSDVIHVKDLQETDLILTTPEKFDSATRRCRDHGGAGFLGDIALLLIDEVHLLNDTRGATLEAIVSRMKMLARCPELKDSSISHIRFVAVSATTPNIDDLAEWLLVPANAIKRFGEEMRPVKLTSRVYGYSAAKNDYLFEKANLDIEHHEELRNPLIMHVRNDLLSSLSYKIAICCTMLTSTRKSGGLLTKFSRKKIGLVHKSGTYWTDVLFAPPHKQRLQYFLYDMILQHSSGKPTLVFCPTRKGAQETAMKLAETVTKPGVKNPFIKTDDQLIRLQAAAGGTNDKNMQFCIQRGVAFHNGGVGLAERGLVEGLFLQGDLQVLCTTMTLAHGMNLPAHLVIIKSTQYYNKEQGRYVEYERSTLLQMSGRAGRPQFDDSGVVVLMTKNETKHLYQNLLSGSEPVESKLLPSIAEHLNAEIVLMTVSDVGLAMEWLKCSFLYIRLRKNPQHYGVNISLPEEQMDKHLKGICLQSIHELANYGMVQMDEYGFTLKHLEPGRLMAKYYLNFETMKTVTKIPEPGTTQELLHSLTKAQELSWIQLRRYEKRQLNSINQETTSRIKFHVPGPNGNKKKRIQTSSEKIFVLVNDALSGEPSTLDFTMTQDASSICTHGARISRCMSDYFRFLRRYSETKNSLLLTKCLRQRLWDDSAYQLKQLPGIGLVTAKALLSAGISSFEKLATSDPRTLELITGRKFPFGDHIKSTLSSLPPKVELKIRDTNLQIGGKREFVLELTRLDSSTAHATNKWHMADLIVGDEPENHLLFHERIRLDQFSSPYIVPVYSTSSISAALISEQFVGIDIFFQPMDHIAPKKSSESITPLKAQQHKRKFKGSGALSTASSSVYDRESRFKMPSQDQRSEMELPVTSTNTSTAYFPVTTYFRYGDTTTAPLQVCDATEDDGSAVIQPTMIFKPVPDSPLGQDLKSLQSFLQDPKVQQSMCSDEGISCLVNSILVASPSLNSHPHAVKAQENLPGDSSPTRSPTRPPYDHDRSRRPCGDFERESNMDVVNTVCVKAYEARTKPSGGNFETERISSETASAELCNNETTKHKARISGTSGFLEADQFSTVPERTACPDGPASNRSAQPDFNFGLPRSTGPEEDTILRYWNVPHNGAPEIRNVYYCGSDYLKASTSTDYFDSDGDSSLLQVDSLGSKSLFSFLHE